MPSLVLFCWCSRYWHYNNYTPATDYSLVPMQTLTDTQGLSYIVCERLYTAGDKAMLNMISYTACQDVAYNHYNASCRTTRHATAIYVYAIL